MSLSSFELKNRIVRAGAGAGKTTRLIEEVISIVDLFRKHKKPLPRIIVTTFTRKATQELKERLMLAALKRDDIELLNFVSSSQLHISTIHGILNLFLLRYGHHFELDPSFAVVGSDIQETFDWIVRDTLLENKELAKLEELFCDYGWSKLNEMVKAYYWMFLEKSELNLFSLTEAKKIKETYENHWYLQCKIIHDSLWEILQTQNKKPSNNSWQQFLENLATTIKIFEANQDSWSQLNIFWKEIRKPTLNKNNNFISPEYDSQIKDFLNNFKKEYLQNTAFDLSFFYLFEQRGILFEILAKTISKKFRQIKIEKGLLEIRDLESLTLHFLRMKPSVAQSFSTEWDYWLIDEFQDTSPLQVELLKLMIGNKPCFFVGDPQQSIYLFRGAQVAVFAQNEEEIKTQGGHIDYLSTNYRSKDSLLEFFNDFFGSLKNSKFQKMTAHNIQQQKSFKNADGNDCCYNKDKNKDKDTVKPIATFALITDNCENIDAVTHITNDNCSENNSNKINDITTNKEFIALLSHISSLIEDGISPKEIAVLAQTNKDLELISRFLNHHQVPNQVHAAKSFYKRREIRDALSLLKFLIHPYDNLNVLEVLRSPWFNVKDSVLHKILKKDQLFWSSLTTAAEQLETKESINNELWAIHILSKIIKDCEIYGVSWAFQKAINECGLIDWSLRYDVTGRRESNIWKLINLLRQEEKKPGFNYLEFIKNAKSKSNNYMEDGDNDAVAALSPQCIQLMTIHAAKGLEFDHVIVPGLDKAQQLSSSYDYLFVCHNKHWAIPIKQPESENYEYSLLHWDFIQQRKAAEKQEFLRLLYVALTRAKQTVFLSGLKIASKNSWLASLNWNLEEGLHIINKNNHNHNHANYSYLVRFYPF